MQRTYTMPKPYREPLWTYERAEKLREWYRKPFTPRAEMCVSAVVGAVFGLLLFLVYMLR